MSDTRQTVMALRVISACAEKLAADLEHGRAWPDDYGAALAVIQAGVRDLPNRKPTS